MNDPAPTEPIELIEPIELPEAPEVEVSLPEPFRAAIIVDGRVQNTILVCDVADLPDLHLVPSDTAGIGDSYADGLFAPGPPAPVLVPKSLTPLQTRKVLNVHGLRAQVETAIAAAGADARDAWEWANAIQRDDPLVMSLTVGLGLTAEQVDALFIEGADL